MRKEIFLAISLITLGCTALDFILIVTLECIYSYRNKKIKKEKEYLLDEINNNINTLFKIKNELFKNSKVERECIEHNIRHLLWLQQMALSELTTEDEVESLRSVLEATKIKLNKYKNKQKCEQGDK